MSKFRKIILAAAVFLGVASQPAQAGIPVFDGANLAQSVQQVLSWTQQFKQMADQYQQSVAQYQQLVATKNSISGARGMADLVNNPALRSYLPSEYNAVLTNGIGAWKSIADSMKIFDVTTTGLNQGSASSKSYNAYRNQVAMDRAAFEKVYSETNKRFADLQVLMQKVNAAPDDKDIQDLQARIAAESTMLQNEQMRVEMLAKLSLAQQNIRTQQVTESRIASTNRPYVNWSK